jgi:hypothetical protein
MMRWIVPAVLLLSACSPGPEQIADSNEQANLAPSAPAEPAAPPAGTDPRSPEAAVQVLRDYFAALSERRFADARRLWSDGGRASGMSEAEFARSFQAYRTLQGSVGAPGRMEGAAGSSYVDIPATVSGRARDGSSFRRTGTFTLRRANDVTGATPEQLRWRIYKTDLQLGQAAADYRFVGRWATEERDCATRAWTFTASSLKTPAGSVCGFSRVSEVPGGYDIAARCTAEGPPTNDVLQLRFAESARALLFESTVIADAGLVRCR